MESVFPKSSSRRQKPRNRLSTSPSTSLRSCRNSRRPQSRYVLTRISSCCSTNRWPSTQSEAKAHTSHTKVLTEFQKLEAIFLAARAKYEAAQARLHSEEETLEIVRNNARDATERLQEKSQEVDSLRTMYGVDERERAAKLAEISAKSAEHKSSWFSR